jgi:hypothetical protein
MLAVRPFVLRVCVLVVIGVGVSTVAKSAVGQSPPNRTQKIQVIGVKVDAQGDSPAVAGGQVPRGGSTSGFCSTVDGRNEQAVTDNATTTPVLHALAASRDGHLWKNGSTLRVRYLGYPPLSTSRPYAMIRECMNEWEKYANIRFEVVPKGDAEIRIFLHTGRNFSIVGTGGLSDPTLTSPTMELTDINEADVLHEFGHALGLIHEHQSPKVAFEWNREAVLADARLLGWSKKMCDASIFRKEDCQNSTEFDPDSIMAYAIPSRWLKNGNPIKKNSKLSKRDKEFISWCYPKRD